MDKIKNPELEARLVELQQERMYLLECVDDHKQVIKDVKKRQKHVHRELRKLYCKID